MEHSKASETYGDIFMNFNCLTRHRKCLASEQSKRSDQTNEHNEQPSDLFEKWLSVSRLRFRISYRYSKVFALNATTRWLSPKYQLTTFAIS